MSDVLQDLEQEVAIFARRMEFARQTGDGTTSLDRSAYLLLSSIHRRGGMTMGEISEVFHLDMSTVSRQISPLVELEFIARERSDADRRKSTFHITPTGHAKLEEVRRARKRLYAEILEDWSDGERETFLVLLRRLNQRIRERQQARNRLD